MPMPMPMPCHAVRAITYAVRARPIRRCPFACEDLLHPHSLVVSNRTIRTLRTNAHLRRGWADGTLVPVKGSPPLPLAAPSELAGNYSSGHGARRCKPNISNIRSASLGLEIERNRPPIPRPKDTISKNTQYNARLDRHERNPQPVHEGDVEVAQEVLDVESHAGSVTLTSQFLVPISNASPGATSDRRYCGLGQWRNPTANPNSE
ncbi:hypothetical protein F4825DRAFT_453562 [Nemania diffusa]|nr:hypothetical protein F4825DRAFT_453562 [Nemania diffusa]